MPSVRDLSALYENFMLTPRLAPGVCRQCFNLTDGYDLCYACTRVESSLDVVAPISYSIAHEQLHHALASYKRVTGEVAQRLALQLAAVLWRYLEIHETCLARAAGTDTFPLVTTVPSGDRDRDERHPLRSIVAELVRPTRDRYERLLRRSSADVAPRTYDPGKFAPQRPLQAESILLIDDTWTTGANAQSAAAALRAAGAGPIAALVIGRHVNRKWHDNDRRLCALPRPFDWRQCARCVPVDPRPSRVPQTAPV
jgi:predicted amidophosphoribosyltransferase